MTETPEYIAAGLSADAKRIILYGDVIRSPFPAMSLILHGLADYRRRWIFGRKRLVLTKQGKLVREFLREKGE